MAKPAPFARKLVTIAQDQLARFQFTNGDLLPEFWSVKMLEIC
jgi:hypothetical protein